MNTQKKSLKKFWIEYLDADGLHTIGDTPFEGIDAEDAWQEYVIELGNTGETNLDRSDYKITEA